MKFHDFRKAFSEATGAKALGIDDEGAKGLIQDLFELSALTLSTTVLIKELIETDQTNEAKELAEVMADGIISRLADTLAANVTPLDEKEATAAKVDAQKAALAAAMRTVAGSC